MVLPLVPMLVANEAQLGRAKDVGLVSDCELDSKGGGKATKDSYPTGWDHQLSRECVSTHARMGVLGLDQLDLIWSNREKGDGFPQHHREGVLCMFGQGRGITMGGDVLKHTYRGVVNGGREGELKPGRKGPHIDLSPSNRT